MKKTVFNILVMIIIGIVGIALISSMILNAVSTGNITAIFNVILIDITLLCLIAVIEHLLYSELKGNN